MLYPSSKAISRYCLSAFLAFSSSFLYAATPEPKALLMAMGRALSEQSFSGEFTIEHGSKMESFHIAHQLHEGELQETLYRLTGDENEFLRKSAANCATLGERLLAGAAIQSGTESVSLLEHYKAAVVGQARVAGRNAWLLQLSPMDDFRFGLTLAIDEESQLLTRYVVYDAQKRAALERMQFVSIKLGDDSSAPSSDNAVELRSEQCVADTSLNIVERSPWRPSWLPPGFVLSAYVADSRHGHIETYTDGLSSFSVFARTGVKPAGVSSEIQQGVSTRGAVMALITAIPMESDTLYVSVLGEIPLSTAQKVSLSLRPHVKQEAP